jgi:hypothetical protein
MIFFTIIGAQARGDLGNLLSPLKAIGSTSVEDLAKCPLRKGGRTRPKPKTLGRSWASWLWRTGRAPSRPGNYTRLTNVDIPRSTQVGGYRCNLG